MSDYRRLISYIYAYEGGIKGKNIGYAKVEIRGGQCRIQVNVKRVFVGSNETGVYLLAPEAEILLGRIFIRGGAGEFRTQVNAENVEVKIIAPSGVYDDIQKFVDRMKNETVDVKQLGLVGRTKEQILQEIKELYMLA